MNKIPILLKLKQKFKAILKSKIEKLKAKKLLCLIIVNKLSLELEQPMKMKMYLELVEKN